MRLKKLSALLLAGALTLGLAACTSPAPAETTPPPAADPGTEVTAPVASDLKVGVFYYQFSDVYITSVRASMDEQLKLLGVNFQNFDGANSQPTQNDQISTAITDGYNLLIVNIVETASPEAAQSAVDTAKNAGIPIIFFNREVSDDVVNSYDKCAFVGTNAPEAGHLQGKMIGEYLLANWDTADLNGDGKITYAMMKGQEGNAEAEARTQFGVEDADAVLTAAGKPALSYFMGDDVATKFQVDPNGAWSQQAGFDFMSTNMGAYSEGNNNMIELVICNNDGMAEGVVSALQAQGYNNGGDSKMIPVFGVDATDNAKTLIKEGKMTATVKQDAVGMASTICALVNNLNIGDGLMDNTADFNVDAGVSKIRVPYGVFDINTQE